MSERALCCVQSGGQGYIFGFRVPKDYFIAKGFGDTNDVRNTITFSACLPASFKLLATPSTLPHVPRPPLKACFSWLLAINMVVDEAAALVGAFCIVYHCAPSAPKRVLSENQRVGGAVVDTCCADCQFCGGCRQTGVVHLQKSSFLLAD